MMHRPMNVKLEETNGYDLQLAAYHLYTVSLFAPW
jgi:hypothetical protein